MQTTVIVLPGPGQIQVDVQTGETPEELRDRLGYHNRDIILNGKHYVPDEIKTYLTSSDEVAFCTPVKSFAGMFA
jgi:molybdopterin converting factor small subunit